MTTTRSGAQPSCWARSARAYWSRVDSGMAADLLQGRLADIDDGEPVTVAAVDLVREGWG